MLSTLNNKIVEVKFGKKLILNAMGKVSRSAVYAAQTSAAAADSVTKVWRFEFQCNGIFVWVVGSPQAKKNPDCDLGAFQSASE